MCEWRYEVLGIETVMRSCRPLDIRRYRSCKLEQTKAIVRFCCTKHDGHVASGIVGGEYNSPGERSKSDQYVNDASRRYATRRCSCTSL